MLHPDLEQTKLIGRRQIWMTRRILQQRYGPGLIVGLVRVVDVVALQHRFSVKERWEQVQLDLPAV